MYVPDIEAAVEEFYPTIEIPEHIVTALRELIVAEFDRLHETSRRDRGTYLAERNDLGDRRKKLLDAHLDGAVPVDLLKEEQDKIARRLAFLDAQINAGDIEYDQAKAHLDDCLRLAGDCYKLYMSIDDSLRRIANQAFFDKLYVQTDDQIDRRPGEPFNIFFDPDVQQLATTRQRAVETGTQTGQVVSLNNDQLVGPKGLRVCCAAARLAIARPQAVRKLCLLHRCLSPHGFESPVQDNTDGMRPPIREASFHLWAQRDSNP